MFDMVFMYVIFEYADARSYECQFENNLYW